MRVRNPKCLARDHKTCMSALARTLARPTAEEKSAEWHTYSCEFFASGKTEPPSHLILSQTLAVGT